MPTNETDPIPQTQAISLAGKDQTYWSIFDAVARLDIQKGHLNWTISDLSRASKVSRSLIYYYFGQSKETIMQSAVDFLGQEYFGLSEHRMALWQKGQILESILNTREMFCRAPYIAFFYLARRSMNTAVGERLREYESGLRKKIKTFSPASSEPQIEALAAVFFGLVTCPQTDTAAIKAAIELILKNVPFHFPDAGS